MKVLVSHPSSCEEKDTKKYKLENVMNMDDDTFPGSLFKIFLFPQTLSANFSGGRKKKFALNKFI